MRGRRTQNKKKNGASETVVSTSRRLAATTRSATRQKRLSRTSMTTSHHKSLASIYADRPSVQDRLNTYSDPYVTNTHTLSLESLARAAISRTSDLSTSTSLLYRSRHPSVSFVWFLLHSCSYPPHAILPGPPDRPTCLVEDQTPRCARRWHMPLTRNVSTSRSPRTHCYIPTVFDLFQRLGRYVLLLTQVSEVRCQRFEV